MELLLLVAAEAIISGQKLGFVVKERLGLKLRSTTVKYLNNRFFFNPEERERERVRCEIIRRSLREIQRVRVRI